MPASTSGKSWFYISAAFTAAGMALFSHAPDVRAQDISFGQLTAAPVKLAQPLQIGGVFTECPNSTGCGSPEQQNISFNFQREYHAEMKDLFDVIEQYKRSQSNPSAGIKAYSDLLDGLEKIAELPDTELSIDGKIELMTAVADAGVNLIVRMSQDQIYSNDRPSPKQSLDAQSAVCKQTARLKVMALEKAGRHLKINARVVTEIALVRGQQEKTHPDKLTGHTAFIGHDVAMVTVGNVTWVLNNPVPDEKAGSLTFPEAWQLIYEHSRLETPWLQLNYDGQSHFFSADMHFYPYVSYNSGAQALFPNVRLSNQQLEIQPSTASQRNIQATSLYEILFNKGPAVRSMTWGALLPALSLRHQLPPTEPMNTSAFWKAVVKPKATTANYNLPTIAHSLR